MSTIAYEGTPRSLVEKCGNCRFYRADSHAEGIAYCLRYPPRQSTMDMESFLPSTKEASYCGEWQPGHQEIPAIEGDMTAKEILKLIIESPYIRIRPGKGDSEKFEPLRKKALEMIE